jgi:hypothetical protein
VQECEINLHYRGSLVGGASSLLQEPGWHDIVVKNPWPLHPEIGQEWGDGTSNKAHLIVSFEPN